MTKIELLLSNPKDESDQYAIFMDILDSSLSKKWVTELKRILQTDVYLEKNFCFVGFPNSSRNIEYVCQRANHFIEQINNYKAPGAWEDGYRIDLKLTAEEISKPQVQERILNEMHHHFEILMGQVWNHADFFMQASNEIRYAIRQINNLCHEIEHLVRAIVRENKEENTPATLVSFLNAPRIEMTDEDYDSFVVDRGFGYVFMHYCQAGKTHWEAFIDNDEHIDDQNISGLRYYSAEFDIEWGDDYSNFPWWNDKIKNFPQWLKKNDCNPDDKKLSLGWALIAKIPREQFGDLKISEIHSLLGRYLNLYKISVIEDDDKKVSRTFGMPLSDAEQIAVLFD